MNKRDEWTYPHKGSELLGFAKAKLQKVELAKEQCLEDHKDAKLKRKNRQPPKITKLSKSSLLSPCFWIDLFCPPEDPELETDRIEWMEKNLASYTDIVYGAALAAYSDQINQLNICIYEFTRNPNKEFALSLKDILFFGLIQGEESEN